MYSYTNDQKILDFVPGYYKVEIKGAQGGRGCGNDKFGGYGALIKGKMHLNNDYKLKITAGSQPKETCVNENSQPAGIYGEGAPSGGKNVGAGGGYSSILANGVIIAMAGGGGGAAVEFWGISGGGYDKTSGKSYRLTYRDQRSLKHEEINSLNPDHKGKHGQSPSGGTNTPGSGGGGGYFGGRGGQAYIYNPFSLGLEKYKSVGQGGSSYVDANYFTSFDVFDGENEEAYIFGHGKIEITNITTCNSNCLDCEIDDRNVCSLCRPGLYMYQSKCYASCSNLGFPAFGTQDFRCESCMNSCKECTNSNTCSKCIDGYHFDGQRCIKTVGPIEPQVTTTTNDVEDVIPTTDEVEIISNSTTTSQNNLNGGDGLKISPDDKQKEDQKFPWWIILVVGCVAVIAVVIVVVVYKRMKKEESVSMEDENVTTDCDRTTSVTVDNPLYIEQKSQQDPFKDDFEEGFSEGGVFNHGDIEEQEDYQV